MIHRIVVNIIYNSYHFFDVCILVEVSARMGKGYCFSSFPSQPEIVRTEWIRFILNICREMNVYVLSISTQSCPSYTDSNRISLPRTPETRYCWCF